MRNKLETLKTKTKVLIYLELFLLFLFFVMTVVEIILSVNLSSTYNAKQNDYFIYVINKGLVQNKYFSNYYMLNDTSKACPDGYTEQKFLQLKYLNNVTLEDITNKIKVVDTNSDPSGQTYYDNIFEKWNFYYVDLSKKGSQSITLMYDYVFGTLGGFKFCAMNFYPNSEYKAFNIISETKSCSEVFANQAVADCGVYQNKTYRVCMLLNQLSYENGTLLSDTPGHDDAFYCPYNALKINITTNTAFNSSNVNSMPFKVTLVYSLRNESEDKELIDTSFFFNFDPFPSIGEAYTLVSPNDTYIYNDNTQQLYYTVGSPYGIETPLSIQVDSVPFDHYYNLSFFQSPSLYKYFPNSTDETNYTPFPPPFLDYNSDYNFYFPKSDRLMINFTSNNFPIISANCFKNIFEADSITAIFNFFQGLSTSFFTETSNTLIAWLLAKLFISLWCYGKIRMLVLIEKKNLKLGKPDKDSEAVTFFTFKGVSLTVFVILFCAVFMNLVNFQYIATWADVIIEQQCFSTGISYMIKVYKEFASTMKSINDNILICLFISLFTELAGIVIFLIYEYSDNKPMTVENIHIEDALLNKHYKYD